MHIEPVTCLRPTPECAAAFASLPYDVFGPDEARAYVEAHPTSFLAIDRPETGFSPDEDPSSDEAYAHAVRLLRERQLDDTLVRDEHPCYYLYELTTGDHRQMGLVGAMAVDDYLDGTLRKHEHTLPQKEAERVRHITSLRAQTGPVFVAYRDSAAIDAILAMAKAAEPLYDFVSQEGVRQRVWRIARPVAVEAIGVAFTTVGEAYIADGHHRAAASARICETRRAEGRVDDPAEYFLAVLFPASQLRILAYDRILADCCGMSEQDLVAAVEEAGFACSAPQDRAVRPAHKGKFGLYAFGSWRELVWQGGQDRLDVDVLQDGLLGPVWGIGDPRTDERIAFVGGEDTTELAARTPEGGAAFALYPTSMDEVMATADAGQVMPPKSTWFDPKLLSGLIIRRIW